MRPAAIAFFSRSGRSSVILAFEWVLSVMNPAWLPVKLSAGTPRSWRAMHTRAVALRSPAVMSMSISRPGRTLDTSEARRSSSSVSLPIALTTRTTSSPRRRVRATWSATSRMRSGSATDVPPNFWTTRATRSHATAAPTPLRKQRLCAVPSRSGSRTHTDVGFGRRGGRHQRGGRAPLTSPAMPSQKRQRQDEGRLARLEAERAAQQAAQRRKNLKWLLGILGAVVLAALAISVFSGGGDDDDDVATEDTTTTTAADGEDGEDTPTPVEVILPGQGASITGETPCPPADGS